MRIKTKAREFALQYLYQVDITKKHTTDTIETFVSHFIKNKDVEKHTRKLIDGVLERLERVDEAIDRSSENWPVRRMSKTDRNILRISAYELLFTPDVPYKVVINEGIELAKRFGSTKSSSFVNGILDRIRTEKGL